MSRKLDEIFEDMAEERRLRIQARAKEIVEGLSTDQNFASSVGLPRTIDKNQATTSIYLSDM